MKQAIPQESFQGKVILLTHEYPPFRGGVATYCHEVIKAASELKLPLEIWAPEHPQHPPSVASLKCGSTLSPWNHLKMALALHRRRTQLRNCRIILASVMPHRIFMILAVLGRLPHCRIDSLIHGSEMLKFQTNFFWKFSAKLLFKKISAVFVASEFSRTLVLKYFPDANIIPATCAASSAAAKNISSEKKSDSFRILTLARIHPRKGQLETATALSLLPENLKKKIVYQIAGKGDEPYLRRILDFCSQHYISCEYLGEISDDQLAQTYADADLFVMTSKTLKKSIEGFGISYLEAAWHGKPSIAFDTGGVSEAVLHNQTGILVPENDCPAAANAIQQLIEDPTLYTRLSQNARSFARSFNWQTTAQTIFSGKK